MHTLVFRRKPQNSRRGSEVVCSTQETPSDINYC